MRLAVLGLGKMGHALAERLLDGDHELTVWNRTAHKGDDLVARGAREEKTPARAVADAEAVFTSLADDAAVRAVATGPQGVAGGLGEASVLADVSTVSPQTSRYVAEVVAGRMLATPVLGAPAAVLGGKATYLVGGAHLHYERLRQAFDSLADTEHRRYVGDDPGLATTLKLLANYLLMSGLATLSEVVSTAQAAGVPDDLVRDFFDGLPLVGPGLRNRLDAIVSRHPQGWFSTTLGAKDVRLAFELACSEGLRLPVAQEIKRLYEQAAAGQLADADIAAIRELIEAQARSGALASGRSAHA